MKLSINNKLLPLITLGTGGIGMVLRIFYLSNRDGKGLLPAHYFGDTLCYILFTCALILLFLFTRQLPNEARFQKLFPGSIRRSIGCFVGGITIMFSSLFDMLNKTPLALPALILGILAAVSLLALGVCRYKGARPSAILLLTPVVYLMLHAVIQARLWSSETQASIIFFPFLASIFLLLHAYFLASLTVKQTGLRAYVFFNQATLLLCCISFGGVSRLFYMGMAAWVGLDLCNFPRKSHRPMAAPDNAAAPTEEEA